jgi:stage III sporulation protein AG
MFNDLFKKNEENKDKKRQIENIVVFIIILIITVLIINNMWTKEDDEEENQTSSKVLAQATTSDSVDQDDLEKKLENILESIDGVGNVKALIKYSESSTVVAMYNETNSESTTAEEDGDGGSKNVKETESKKEIVYSDNDGKSEPVTEKVVMPVIEGAIITAQGASNANIKSSIVSAVEAITGLAVHKIQVFEMGE